MVLAIMQPYFLPYVGYFQLLGAVDKFVIYDDVNYINRGFINRNNFLFNGQPALFTIPLQKASQNKLIREITLSSDTNWQHKLLKTVEQAYRKAPYFSVIYPLLVDLLAYESENVGDFCHNALVKISNYLELQTEIVPSSTVYDNAHLKGQDRILDICIQEKATHYINPQGGMALYDKGIFAEKGIKLSFLKAGLTPYPQFQEPFVPGLSILDMLMFNSVSQVRELLQHYELV
ncbi:MAG: WbqC family protein [Spirosomataceae bacterium]|jgi:hypothetical protein